MRISDWSSDVCSSDLSCAVSTLKLPVMMPLPPVIADWMRGAEITSSSRMMAKMRPTLSRVASPKRLAPSVSKLKETAGRPSWSRSEEHTSELQSLMRISYAVFCLKKKIKCDQHLHTIS